MSHPPQTPELTAEIKRLKHLSLRYLTIRNRSRFEIATYLARKSNQPAAITSVLNHLEQFNLLNDEKFAYEYAEAYLHKGKGERWVKANLKLKGVDPQTICHALDEVAASVAPAAAQKVLQKKFPSWPNLNPNQKYQAYAYLYQRGYETSTIRAAIDGRTVNTVK